MKPLEILKLAFVVVCLSLSAVSEAGSGSGASHSGFPNQTQLFQRLSDAGIDKVVELPYNQSLLGNIGRQVRVHNIIDMQDHRNQRPESLSLWDEYTDSRDTETSQVVRALTYATGEGVCEYMQAVKVNDTLVCYRAATRPSMLAVSPGVSRPRCSTEMSRLSHCYIFAHSVTAVIAALEGSD